MQNKREFFVAAVSFFVGVIATYFGMRYLFTIKVNTYTQFAKQCLRLSEINNELLNQCEASVYEVTTCLGEPSKCDINASMKRFQDINEGSDDLMKEKLDIANKIKQMAENEK